MPNSDRQLLADSSFYLCFLEDIEQPQVLLRILDRFDFLITPIVYREVSKSDNFNHIQKHPKITLVQKENLGQALKPFFSKKQIEKGETEIIELAYQYYANKDPKKFILDDKEPRLFIAQNLAYLEKFMVGTVGFVGECYYDYLVFGKNEAYILVVAIGESTFRVSAEVIREVLAKIESR
jgi:predicted nucleic acid-binding protein